jgi:tRNA A37 threonylcarbamoyladenosine modification protein TsaB
MILIIDTTEKDLVIISFVAEDKTHQRKIKAHYQQAEKLLPSIVKMMNKLKITWSEIKEIKVQSKGGGFSSLRIGVLTANALAYALKIPVKALHNDQAVTFAGGQAVKPEYQSEPNIGPPRAPAC